MPVTLIVEPLVLAVSRLEPDAPVPPWASGGFLAITRTHDELSIICEASQVPVGVRSDAPWAWLRVEGPLPFSLVGILARLTAPLAEARIPVLASRPSTPTISSSRWDSSPGPRSPPSLGLRRRHDASPGSHKKVLTSRKPNVQ